MFSKRDLSVGIFLLKGIEIDCVMCGGGDGGEGGRGFVCERGGERDRLLFYNKKHPPPLLFLKNFLIFFCYAGFFLSIIKGKGARTYLGLMYYRFRYYAIW